MLEWLDYRDECEPISMSDKIEGRLLTYQYRMVPEPFVCARLIESHFVEAWKAFGAVKCT